MSYVKAYKLIEEAKELLQEEDNIVYYLDEALEELKDLIVAFP